MCSSDLTGATPNENPVILDSRGEANIWLGDLSYKFRLTDANDVDIWTVDYVTAPLTSVSPVLSGNVTISTDSLSPALKITQIGTGYALLVQDSTDPDTTPFVVTNNGRYLPAKHVVPLSAKENDFVAVAERFVGVPYLWGGKTSFGLDCSGLVQVSLTAAGVLCPRDSDMQDKALGASLPLDAKFKRGDLLFWPGHVAIVRDENTLVHANGFAMATALESISDAIARIEKAGSKLRSVRRL